MQEEVTGRKVLGRTRDPFCRARVQVLGGDCLFLTTRKPGCSVGFVRAAKFQVLKWEESESSP